VCGEAAAISGTAYATGVKGYSKASHGLYGVADGAWGWVSGVYGGRTEDHAEPRSVRRTARFTGEIC